MEKFIPLDHASTAIVSLFLSVDSAEVGFLVVSEWSFLYIHFLKLEASKIF